MSDVPKTENMQELLCRQLRDSLKHLKKEDDLYDKIFGEPANINSPPPSDSLLRGPLRAPGEGFPPCSPSDIFGRYETKEEAERKVAASLKAAYDSALTQYRIDGSKLWLAAKEYASRFSKCTCFANQLIEYRDEIPEVQELAHALLSITAAAEPQLMVCFQCLIELEDLISNVMETCIYHDLQYYLDQVSIVQTDDTYFPYKANISDVKQAIQNDFKEPALRFAVYADKEYWQYRSEVEDLLMKIRSKLESL